MKRLLSRRSFVKESAKIAAGICFADILSPLLCYGVPVPKRTIVGLVRSSKVWDGNTLSQSMISQMLNRGIQSISGHDSPSKAWNSFFSPKDIVALKVNCIGKAKGSTKPELSYAVAESLYKYANIPLENIIIFDRWDKEMTLAGYKINKSGKGVQVYATPSYSSPIKSGDILTGVSTLITKKCTALINLPLLKTHSGAKLTLSLKNHYGSIPPKKVQTNRFHMRDLDCIVHVNSLAPIREKTRLCIADGLLAQFNQGPEANPKYQWRYSSLIIGTDPVAVDTIGLKVINEKRKAKKLPTFKVKYVKWAAEEGLGKNDPDSIELIRETI